MGIENGLVRVGRQHRFAIRAVAVAFDAFSTELPLTRRKCEGNQHDCERPGPGAANVSTTFDLAEHGILLGRPLR
ncbi:hypothetical protein ABID25_006046 [Mesorhizobium abyssinicae]